MQSEWVVVLCRRNPIIPSTTHPMCHSIPCIFRNYSAQNPLHSYRPWTLIICCGSLLPGPGVRGLPSSTTRIRSPATGRFLTSFWLPIRAWIRLPSLRTSGIWRPRGCSASPFRIMEDWNMISPSSPSSRCCLKNFFLFLNYSLLLKMHACMQFRYQLASARLWTFISNMISITNYNAELPY